MQRLSTVQLATGPKSSQTYWGSEKRNLLNMGPDDAMAMARRGILSIRGPGSLGSLRVETIHVKRLHRTRRRFQQFFSHHAAHKTMNSLAMASKGSEGPKNRRMWSRRLPDHRPIPEGRRADLPPKKVNKLGPMAPPAKNANYPRAPSSRRSGLVGPYTTPPIVNYKYMTSTSREGYFGLPTPGREHLHLELAQVGLS